MANKVDDKEKSTTMRQRRIRAAAWLLASLSEVHAATHSVKVGEGGLTFSPETLMAEDGDVISYSFHSGVSPAPSLPPF